ncbi:hypothetical protein LZ554_002293 [Drepanopeziza brunnea f. sp. 'monogermtubi']|nr:hypothetical protein LZ554_002293 [Drepanopeziza brunnea f. sp. 'monogermtubi']
MAHPSPEPAEDDVGNLCNVAIETLLILSSLSLPALAIAVVYYEDEISRGVGTAFPYVFALVVGRAVKLFAAWRLEQGISLGVLEQIIGSSTLGGLLTTHSLLRPFNLASLGLFTLWIFSPIGSRVSLGLIEPRDRPVTAAVQYLDTAQQSKFYSEVPEEVPEVIARPIASVYSSSLMTPDAFKNSSMDLWGNVKIPYYSRLPEPIVADASGWTQVSESRDIVYSSFIGIPMSKNNIQGANTTWTMTTTYLELNCFNITKILNIPAYKESDGIIWRRIGDQTSFTVAINGFISPSTSPESSRSVSAFINATNSSSIPPTLLFQSVIWGENPSGITNSTIMATSYCDLSQTYVDAEVLRRTMDCRVTAMRPSESPHAPGSFTVFGFERGFHMFSWLLPLATGENILSKVAQSTATELYISGITS